MVLKSAKFGRDIDNLVQNFYPESKRVTSKLEEKKLLRKAHSLELLSSILLVLAATEDLPGSVKKKILEMGRSNLLKKGVPTIEFLVQAQKKGFSEEQLLKLVPEEEEDEE
jgi:hypothetical protein